MSSRDGIPVDVISVDRDEGDICVPGKELGCFAGVFLLNEDIVKAPWETVLAVIQRRYPFS
jgi:hypothetical protein